MSTDTNLAASQAIGDLIDDLAAAERNVGMRLLQYLAARIFVAGEASQLAKIRERLIASREIFAYAGLRAAEASREAGRLLAVLQQVREHRHYPRLVRLLAVLRLPPLRMVSAVNAVENVRNAGIEGYRYTLPAELAADLHRPDSAAWQQSRKMSEPDDAACVSIVVPVYRGIEETLTGLHAVLNVRNSVRARLVVIDDNSPDAELSDVIGRLARMGHFELIRHTENRGFVSSVNEGMLAAQGDVVLLNADAVVTDGWLDELHAAARSRDDVGSLSPMTNNATILSYPRINELNYLPADTRLDRLSGYLGARGTGLVEVPTTVGFCMYIPRAALDAVGIFDEAAFGLGYGEESDWAMRARGVGFRHYACPSVFVYHHGSISFSESARKREMVAGEIIRRRYPGYWPLVAAHIANDPLRNVRRALDQDRLYAAMPGTESVLHIVHAIGGGTLAHVDHLATSLLQLKVSSLFAAPDATGKLQMTSNVLSQTPNITYDFVAERQELADFLRRAGVRAVHIHHMFGFSASIVDWLLGLDIPIVLTLHDYMYVCPQIVLLNQHNRFCGVQPSIVCNRCVAAKTPPLPAPNVAAWRAEFRALLGKAAKIVAPSQAARELHQRLWPDLAIEVIEHSEPGRHSAPIEVTPAANSERIVAIVGTIIEHKGPAVVEACVRDAENRNLPLKFVVIGDLHGPLTSPKLTVTGRFAPSMLPRLVAESGASIGFLPSIWPETYSYVLSEYFQLGLYPVVFDLGAQADRVRQSFGTILPNHMAPSAINDALLALDLKAIRPKIPAVTDDLEYVRACYGQLIGSQATPRTVAAGPTP